MNHCKIYHGEDLMRKKNPRTGERTMVTVKCDGQWHKWASPGGPIYNDDDFDMVCKCPEYVRRRKARKMGELIEDNPVASDRAKEYTFDNYIQCKPNNHILQVARLREFLHDNIKTIRLTGSQGRGKSHLAMALAREAAEGTMHVEVMEFSDLQTVLASKDSYNDSDERKAAISKYSDVMRCDLFVIDGLNTSVTPKFRTKFKTLLDKLRGKLLITISAGLTNENIEVGYGPEVWSRLQSRSEEVDLPGVDMREEGY